MLILPSEDVVVFDTLLYHCKCKIYVIVRYIESICIIITVILKQGVLDPPSNIYLTLEGNSLRNAWDYVRIPTVDVTLYWSLSSFRPSQLSNITTTLLNTNTYNYTLQGVSSCDPFRQCKS